jgi:crossover junction endodeoxyribonuclease RusA
VTPIHLELHGPIVPYVRMTRRGKYVRDDAQRYLASQTALRVQMRLAMARAGYEMMPLQTPLMVEIYLGWVDHRCDLDNLAKACLDAGNGILWPDDRWIDELYVRREKRSDGITIDVTEEGK